MLLNLRAQYSAGTTPRQTADAVITALSPAAWYRNATGVTSAGGFASQWDDYSGNGRHLVQATGTNQPAYSAGVLTADGADNFMVASSWSMAQPVTYYLVGKQITWTHADTLVDGTTNATGITFQLNASPTLSLYSGAAVADNTNLAVGSSGILCAVFNGASSSLRVNNTAKTTGNPGALAMGGVTLGARGSAAFFANFEAWEFVVFNAAHDDTTQSSVITALNNALTVF